MTNDFTKEQIAAFIDDFLLSRYNKNTKTQQKKLAKAIEKDDAEQINELNTVIQQQKEKYQKANWLAEAKKITKSVRVATHISKGIHSGSKGDNVNFVQEVCHDYVNTKTPNSRFLDDSSGAQNLPLIDFFEWEVIENSGIKMRDLILQNTPAVAQSFADDKAVSEEYQKTFLACLNNQINEPKTCEKNKQTLWPLPQQNADEDNYVALVPLYPVVLAHEVFNKINQNRYSEDNKTARENRKKKIAEQKPYLTMQDLAIVKLGGENSQNVSYLMSKQTGINYLLPSMPPSFIKSQDIRIPTWATSIFETKALQYQTQDTLKALFNIIKTKHNNVNIRDARKNILSNIAYQVICMGETIQSVRPAGWSKQYHNLSMSQKYWLDPKRAELDGEEEFKQARQTKDWHTAIEVDFANWLQAIFKKEFKEIAHEFADPEHNEWKKEIEDEIKQTLRLGKGGLS